MFMQSTNIPKKVVELLAHMGVCIMLLLINLMVKHMSQEAQKSLKKELPTLLSAIGYNNLEIWFDTKQPTATNPGKLIKLTTAMRIPLCPGATKDDLQVSKLLWEQSEFNLK
ncbi:hypothetical protein FRC10_001810 [Ceratobasidium sp. 414]|nr:hypothetical protein FRC10_001810 [Ceratobasidium sp. 414]